MKAVSVFSIEMNQEYSVLWPYPVFNIMKEHNYSENGSVSVIRSMNCYLEAVLPDEDNVSCHVHTVCAAPSV